MFEVEVAGIEPFRNLVKAIAAVVQALEVPEGYLLVVLHNGTEPVLSSVEYNHLEHLLIVMGYVLFKF